MVTGRHVLQGDSIAPKDVGYVPRLYVPRERKATRRRISVSVTLRIVIMVRGGRVRGVFDTTKR